MSRPNRGTERAQEEPEQRASKANKSCEPCRTRKIKCDANIVGVPCSSCVIRESAAECVLHVRKARLRKTSPTTLAPRDVQTAVSPATSHGDRSDISTHAEKAPHVKRPKLSSHTPNPNSPEWRNPSRPEQDLLYLKILNDAVPDEARPNQQRIISSNPPGPSSTDHNLTLREVSWTRTPKIDDISHEFLVKKGVFDLPSATYLNAIVQAYFDHVWSFRPVISRVSFISDYRSNRHSLFLLCAILTAATIYTSADVLTACGFTSPSDAAQSFATKARLLCDFEIETDPLVMLQGFIILNSVILDHPSDRDFDYWLYNAVRLADKLDLRTACARDGRHDQNVKLYRRILWTLHWLDVFRVFVNPKRSRLLENSLTIKPWTDDDWDEEDLSCLRSTFLQLSPITSPQKALPVVLCELSEIFEQFMTIVRRKPQQDPRQMMRPLDIWRTSLASKMHVIGKPETNVYYLHSQAMSYRFECVLCRLLRRLCQQTNNTEWGAWAKERLRCAIVELDMIATRVLTNGTLRAFPMTFVTTMTALLSLHIESALDPNETELIRSMDRISISQSMLVLNQARDMPVLKRALPVFEEILAKKGLATIAAQNVGQEPVQSSPGHPNQAGVSGLSYPQDSIFPLQPGQGEIDPLFCGDFLGVNFLDDEALDNWSLLVDNGSDLQGLG